jgi:hypothetical protein
MYELVALVGIIVLAILAALIIIPKIIGKIIPKLFLIVINSIVGIVLLLIIVFVFNASIPLNAYTILVVLIFGLPGLAVLLILNYGGVI